MMLMILVMVVQLVLQIIIAMVKLALQVASALGYALGWLLASLIGAAWDAWRRRSRNVPLRSPDAITDAREAPPSPPPAQRPDFTPRPLRPRPRR